MEAFLIYLLPIASFAGIVLMLWELKQCYSLHNWPVTKGIIIQSKTGKVRNSKTEYPYIYYKYSVNGKEHISRRIGMYLTHPTGSELLKGLLEKYPLGKEVEVKYHPIFHKRAVLETGKKQLHAYFISGLVFLVLFIFTSSSVFFNYNLAFELIKFLTE